jgi:hypothetical protein
MRPWLAAALEKARGLQPHPHLKKRFLLGLAVSAIVLSGWLIFLRRLPEPNVWAELKATSGYVAFRVTQPDFAAFRVEGLRAGTLEPGWICVDGLVEPKPGVWVEYRRGGPKQLLIKITPPDPDGVAATIPGTKTPLNGEIHLTLDPKSCPKGEAPTRLPIFGPAVFGHQPEPATASGQPPGALLKGEIEVYALASRDLVLGMTFPSLVYLLSSFDLPPGATVCADVKRDREGANPTTSCALLQDSGSAEEEALRSWIGVATPAVSNNGFDVAATTTAPGTDPRIALHPRQGLRAAHRSRRA